MRLIQTAFQTAVSRMKSLEKRGSAVILACMTVIAAVSLLISGFSDSGKNKVYAVQASCDEQNGEIVTECGVQAGLMGIVNSINSMEEYSLAASSVDITAENVQVLVGTSKVRRNVLNRIALGKGTSQIGGVGYYAQQTVRKNHMAAEDYYSLLQVVEAEATGGDLKSKILIANVVLNRVADSRFPDSISPVERRSFHRHRMGESIQWQLRKRLMRQLTELWRGKTIQKAPCFLWHVLVRRLTIRSGLTARCRDCLNMADMNTTNFPTSKTKRMKEELDFFFHLFLRSDLLHCFCQEGYIFLKKIFRIFVDFIDLLCII